MTRVLVFGFVSACALTGCLTVAELRQSPPARVSTARGNYLPLATCVMRSVETAHVEEGVAYQFLNLAAARSASILGVVRFPAGLFYTVPAPVLELTFKQGEPDQVNIEARSRFPGSALEPRVWPVIERCAGTTLKPIPPLGVKGPAGLALDSPPCFG